MLRGEKRAACNTTITIHFRRGRLQHLTNSTFHTEFLKKQEKAIVLCKWHHTPMMKAFRFFVIALCLAKAMAGGYGGKKKYYYNTPTCRQCRDNRDRKMIRSGWQCSHYNNRKLRRNCKSRWWKRHKICELTCSKVGVAVENPLLHFRAYSNPASDQKRVAVVGRFLQRSGQKLQSSMQPRALYVMPVLYGRLPVTILYCRRTRKLDRDVRISRRIARDRTHARIGGLRMLAPRRMYATAV